MNINTFDSYARNGECPICENHNLSSFKNANNMTIYSCNDCGGVPSICNGTLYLSTVTSMDYYNDGVCMNCGERGSANTHAYLSAW